MSRLVRAALATICVAACGPPSTPSRPAPNPFQFTLTDLVGGWSWMHRTTEAGTTRVESESWRFVRTASPSKLAGRYVRTVEVRSDDKLPFQCNQRPWYRQRAVFDLELELTAAGYTIKETAYRAEPSPCDHGFRKVGNYTAERAGDRLDLSWAGGKQTLIHVDSDARALPADPWLSAPALAGPWRWDAVSYDDDGNLRTEHEWWEITKKSETTIDGSYRRRVIVNSSDGKPIPCATATTWTFDDGYVLDGQREEEHWHFHELAAEPGDHPCLRATPKRNLDEATAEQLGDYLILEWRGKRRQILYRPE